MKFALSAIAVAALLANPAVAGQIVRHPAPSPTVPILVGVTIPAGSETVLLSGVLASPIDPSKTDSIEAFGDTRTQTISALGKIKASLAKLGYSMRDVVKLTVFVGGDPKLGGKMDFAGFNDGYKQYFGTAENPNLVARSTVQVAALAGPYFLVEIEAVAARSGTGAK